MLPDLVEISPSTPLGVNFTTSLLAAILGKVKTPQKFLPQEIFESSAQPTSAFVWELAKDSRLDATEDLENDLI